MVQHHDYGKKASVDQFKVNFIDPLDGLKSAWNFQIQVGLQITIIFIIRLICQFWCTNSPKPQTFQLTTIGDQEMQQIVTLEYIWETGNIKYLAILL